MNAALHLIIATFDRQPCAEEALETLRKSRELELIGVQAAVAMRKEEGGQTHLKDVGLTPGQGALMGAVLGTTVGVLSGGTAVALGALGSLLGAYVGKRKRDGRYSTGRAGRLAEALVPDGIRSNYLR